MIDSSQPEQTKSAALERVAGQLAALGAETRTERRVKRVLPWVMSLAIHLGIAVLAIFITWTVANLPRNDESVLIVADFNAMQYEPVASLQIADPQVAAPSDGVVLDLAPPASVVSGIDQMLKQMSHADVDPMSLLAPGEIGLAANDSAAAALSRFAPQSDSYAVRFAGLTGSNARRIVYVIDASGSMIAFLQVVIDELNRSLTALSPQQSYSVIFFQGENAIEVPPAGKLSAATNAQRERTLKWISDNIIPQQGTNPLVALDKAMKLKPDVIFLLSQDITGYGQFEIDQRELLAKLDQANPIDPDSGKRRTQIQCIQFLDEDPLDTMRLIASQHGGVGDRGYKFLSRSELGLGGSAGKQ